MKKPSKHQRKTAITAGTRKKHGKPAKGELTDQELDKASGGDESPKETVTFSYGSVQYKY